VLVWRLPSTRSEDVAVLVAWLVLLQAGLVLSGIDVAVQRLPTGVVAVSAVLIVSLIAVSAVLQRAPDRLLAALAAAAVLGGFCLLLVLVFGSQMGMGDVRVAALLGLLLGTSGWSAVLIGAVLPYVLAVPAAVVQVARGGSTRHGDHLPFGPFLFAGAIIAAVLVG
jgi:leader peptidase (prepilin peptidase)/N-methyltransferase